jgi:hypothetical protein
MPGRTFGAVSDSANSAEYEATMRDTMGNAATIEFLRLGFRSCGTSTGALRFAVNPV